MEQRSSPVAMAQGRGSPLMMPSRRKTASRGHRRHRPAQAENGFRLDLNLQSSEDAGTCQWGARSAWRRPERRWRGGCAASPRLSHQLASGGEGKSGGPSRTQDRRLEAPSKQRGGGATHRRGVGAQYRPTTRARTAAAGAGAGDGEEAAAPGLGTARCGSRHRRGWRRRRQASCRAGMAETPGLSASVEAE